MQNLEIVTSRLGCLILSKLGRTEGQHPQNDRIQTDNADYALCNQSEPGRFPVLSCL